MRANLTPRRAIAGFSFCTRSRHPCAMPVPAATATPSDPAHAPLTGLPGVGPRVAEKLAARGMSTLQDLWLQLPRQYENARSEEHTSELQSLMRSSYAVFCLKNKQSNKT